MKILYYNFVLDFKTKFINCVGEITPKVQGLLCLKRLLGGYMRHCCEFKADDIYYLKETNLYTDRKLSIGFCPICQKPVSELVEVRFDGVIERLRQSGFQAQELAIKLKDQIEYSMRECNYLRFKTKPFGWKYGVNKSVRIKGQERIKQYAYDFYGNKEIIKTI